MNVINQLFSFIVWLFTYEISIGEFKFSLLGAVLLAGIVTLFVCVINWLFRGE